MQKMPYLCPSKGLTPLCHNVSDIKQKDIGVAMVSVKVEIMTSLFQISKMMWLVNLLYSRGELTRAQINEYWANSSLNDYHEFKIARRTFFRMKDEILLLFDVEIAYNKHSRKFFIANQDSIKNNGIQQWLMDNFAVRNTLLEGQRMQDRIILEDIPSGNRFLTTVIEAIRQNRTLQMQYQSFGMSELREFEVSPYCLKVFRQRWYVLGPRTNDPEPHFYSLDRMLSLTMTDHEFKMPDNFDAAGYFSNYYGIMRGDAKLEIVRLRANAFRSNYLRSLPLHHSQQEIETTPEYSVFEYYIVPTADFIQELRSIAPDITILQPEWLRAKMLKDAKTILFNYKN